jgi:TPR repeat protein
MYEGGKWVKQDYVLAHMWYNLAASNGDKSGINNRDIVASQMTPAQIAEAGKMAKECEKKNYKNCD